MGFVYVLPGDFRFLLWLSWVKIEHFLKNPLEHKHFPQPFSLSALKGT